MRCGIQHETFGRGKSCAKRFSFCEKGQSTVEFAVVMAGFAAVLVGLAALMHAFESGVFVQHAASVASHHVAAVVPVTIADIFLY